ncbi:MBL fold metallo-hydrolase [Pyramidobacter sp. CG50-2]|uniref:MBL fold metallo-hydrolase n=1 Tax=Pyramidobacter sp. CG50-2 TaxID=2382160 RepID=UPI000EA1576C|nr:MBL fold metallo-hydrolase [Pyramidobacter sp. CG50-2]RKJ78461.1 MBL fold metallo-hydrolase [Pyramidobacter sp. CG50-2]
MAKISSLCIIDSTCDRPWEVAVRPFPVTNRIYYVGGKWVGAYLVDTGDGLILLDTTTAETSYQLVDAIYRLGYKPEDIKHILLSHAHIDHDGAAKMMRELTGVPIWLSAEDDAFRRTEGSQYVGLTLNFKAYDYEVDYHYNDAEPICLGDVEIRTRLTPGHTPGTTTFFITHPDEQGNPVVAAMHGGVGVLTMSDEILDKAGLPRSQRRRFIDDCDDMMDLKVDVCLASHPAHGALFETLEKVQKGEASFRNPKAWKEFLVSRSKFARDMEDGSK